ncbi:MAG TPA: WYL domain-containing protein, partial [Microthrixaceae bacterium]|nr:WYL domain-containing protein [Microthrixaceae bacterium]
EEQAVAIAVGLQHAAASGVDVGDAADRALATVRQVMPSHLRNRVDAVRFSGAVVEEMVDPDVLEAASRAVHDRTTMRFDYGDAARSRHVEPHGLVARGGRWYLVAWDLDRRDWRIFRLDRMTPSRTPGPRFTPRAIPTGDAATFVAARSKGSTDDDRWPCTGRFEIDLPAAELAPWIRDGKVEEIGPGSSRVTMGSWSCAGLLAAVVRFDAPFRVLAPAELIAEAQLLGERLREGSSSA